MKKVLVLLIVIFSISNLSAQPDWTVYHNSGVRKSYDGDFKGALKDFNEAIRQNPKAANSYLSRGTAKYKLEDYRGACIDWIKARELGDQSAYNLIRKYCN